MPSTGPDEDAGRLSWRRRRVRELARLVAAGEYEVPAEDVALAILLGRPKWGDDPILLTDTVERGRRR